MCQLELSWNLGGEGANDITQQHGIAWPNERCTEHGHHGVIGSELW